MRKAAGEIRRATIGTTAKNAKLAADIHAAIWMRFFLENSSVARTSATMRPDELEQKGVPCVLTINGGSSSIRFAVYEAGETPRRRLDGKIDRVGLSGTNLIVNDPAGTPQVPYRLAAADHRTAAGFLLDWLEAQPVFASVAAVGHRVVHGMKHSAPERVTPKLLTELHRLTPYDPDHLPREIALIEAVSKRHPKLPQVACFDTAFHRTMPRVARLLPIPRRYAAKGVERYGFHGLSYQ